MRDNSSTLWPLATLDDLAAAAAPSTPRDFLVVSDSRRDRSRLWRTRCKSHLHSRSNYRRASVIDRQARITDDSSSWLLGIESRNPRSGGMGAFHLHKAPQALRTGPKLRCFQ